MGLRKNLPDWMSFDRSRPALIAGLALFALSDALDLILTSLGSHSVAAILNNVAIGLLGGLLLLFYLTLSYENQVHARAKERMILVAELNHHVRSALIAIEHSALLEDRLERLHKTEQAVARIDAMLTDLLPTIGSAQKPRLDLRQNN